ncbi:phosphatidylglycerophosphatase A [Neisseria leonii]|uniref:phosphatidylglycerophosphatase A family protein n=1 Tax=Neisseria leonii TaxID=2995413 RepID=UPI00237B93DF|nr:phosphatidylglycerophosphatase A [Neisseria sp. 3986]MDD9325695.1 phosphatidylglycerophosphatase A [Neisseria sp. 3986]
MNPAKPDIRRANACPPCPAGASAADRCIYWLGVGLGSGLPARAPGTWGSLGGLLAALPLVLWGFWPLLAATVAACAVGSYICGRTAELMRRHDDPHIVWDEWAGQWIALLPAAYLYSVRAEQTVGLILAAFVLFRLFDVLKPPPIRWADRHVSGGFGILLDDILAGLMSVGVIGLYLLFGG